MRFSRPPTAPRRWSCSKPHDVQLLLTDINMPVMNGADCCARSSLNERWRNLSRVIISTDGSTARREEADDLDVRCYLEKPFSPEVLRDVLNELADSEFAETE